MSTNILYNDVPALLASSPKDVLLACVADKPLAIDIFCMFLQLDEQLGLVGA